MKKAPRNARLFCVPGVGIEPTLLAEREFESRASTNSATRASLAEKRVLIVTYYWPPSGGANPALVEVRQVPAQTRLVSSGLRP